MKMFWDCEKWSLFTFLYSISFRKKLDVGQIESAVSFFLVFLLLLARDTVLILHSLLTLPSQPTLNQLEFKINKLSD